jgi:HlyD family secretion protein
MKSKRILGIIAVVVVAMIIVLAIGKKAGWFGGDAYIKVAVEKGATRDIIEIITANGKIQPETEVKISPDVSGEIVDLVINEGDYVKKGQYLLKIKPENYIMARNRAEASLNNAKARLKQAEAQLALSQLNFKRNKELFNEKAISESEYEQSETNFSTAKAEKEAAEFMVESGMAALQEAEENLEKTSIFAPMSGTISALNVELGERVVGTELMSGTEILRIADLSKMEVEVEVNENDIVRVSFMDTAFIEVDAYLDTKFKGVVTEIPVSANTTGTTTDQVTNFNVKIRLLQESYQDKVTDNNPYPLRPGMSATADIQTEKKIGVFTVPIQSVASRVYTPEDTLSTRGKSSEKAKEASEATRSSGKNGEESVEEERVPVVFVVTDGKAIMKQVKTGIQDNQFIEIKEGVGPGDEVVKAPYSAITKELKNGTAVEVVPEQNLFEE